MGQIPPCPTPRFLGACLSPSVHALWLVWPRPVACLTTPSGLSPYCSCLLPRRVSFLLVACRHAASCLLPRCVLGASCAVSWCCPLPALSVYLVFCLLSRCLQQLLPALSLCLLVLVVSTSTASIYLLYLVPHEWHRLGALLVKGQDRCRS